MKPHADIIGYECDVGMKAILRRITEYYQRKFRAFLIEQKGNIQVFVETQLLKPSQGTNPPPAENLQIALFSLLNASGNLIDETRRMNKRRERRSYSDKEFLSKKIVLEKTR